MGISRIDFFKRKLQLTVTCNNTPSISVNEIITLFGSFHWNNFPLQTLRTADKLSVVRYIVSSNFYDSNYFTVTFSNFFGFYYILFSNFSKRKVTIKFIISNENSYCIILSNFSNFYNISVLYVSINFILRSGIFNLSYCSV